MNVRNYVEVFFFFFFVEGGEIREVVDKLGIIRLSVDLCGSLICRAFVFFPLNGDFGRARIVNGNTRSFCLY